MSLRDWDEDMCPHFCDPFSRCVHCGQTRMHPKAWAEFWREERNKDPSIGEMPSPPPGFATVIRLIDTRIADVVEQARKRLYDNDPEGPDRSVELRVLDAIAEQVKP